MVVKFGKFFHYPTISWEVRCKVMHAPLATAYAHFWMNV